MDFMTFWDRFNFVFGLLVAELIICWRFPRRKYFWLMILAGCVPSVTLGLTWSLFMPYNLWLSAFKFLILFALTVVMMVAGFKGNFWTYLFVGIMAYCIQHISYQSYSIIVTLATVPDWAHVLLLLVVYAIFYAGLYALVTRKTVKNEMLIVKDYKLVVVSGIVVLITVFISFFGAVYSLGAGSPTLLIIICLFSILSCVMGIFLELTLMTLKKNETELAVMKHIIYMAQHQYEESKESIDIINIKCHDLRHQMTALKSGIDKEELDKISRAVNIYDNTFKLGNEALDVVLTEKSLLCVDKNIRLTCMMDGSTVSFMKDSDIYALFGNAIENAMNGVLKLDEDRRVISISQSVRGNLNYIRIENFYEGKIVLDDGLPVTDKDPDFHGFGMKSMKMIVESYGGELKVSVTEDIFSLNVLLPIQSEQ